MATFDFAQTNGTTAEAIDSRWNGDSASFQTNSGRLVCTTDYANKAMWLEADQGDTQTVQATLKAWTPVGGEKAMLGLQKNGSRSGYEFLLRFSDGDIDITRNGSFATRIATAATPQTTDYVLKAVYTHTTGVVQVFLDGTYVGQWTDTTPLTGGWPGLAMATASNVTAGPAIDNWTDGVTEAPPTAPTAPTGVGASSIAVSSATIGWTDNSTNETSFLVEVESPAGVGNWTTASSNFSNPTAVNATSLVIKGLTSLTEYRARVLARNATGDSTWAYSSAFSTAFGISEPSAPTGVTVSSIGNTVATATWTDTSSIEASFTVEFETPSGAGNWTAAAGASNPTAANATSFSLTGLTSATQHRVRVKASNSGGDSSWALSAPFTTTAIMSFPFAEPNNTTLEQMDSRWDGSSSALKILNGSLIGSADYSVYSAWFAAGQGDTQHVQTTINASAFIASSAVGPALQKHATQAGYVASVSSVGDVDVSRNGTFWHRFNSSATPLTTDTVIRMSYTHTTGVLQVFINGSSIGSWTDTTPLTGGSPGLTIVTGLGYTSGPSLADWTDLVTISAASVPPVEPSSVAASGVSAYAAILHWVDNSNNESGFQVQIETPSGAGNWTAATTSANATRTTLTGLSLNTQYRARVKAFNGVGDSDWVLSSPFTTPASVVAPADPTALTITSTTGTGAGLSWVDESSDETGFKIQVETPSGAGNWANVTGLSANPTAANATSFTVTGLTTDTQYRARVCAANSAGDSGYALSDPFVTVYVAPADGPTFDFEQANGSTLESLDSRWDGASSTVRILNGTLVGTAEYQVNTCWFVAGQGDTQSVKGVIKARTQVAGERLMLTLQTNGSRNGYTLLLRFSDGDVDIERNGAFAARIASPADPQASDVELQAEYNHTTGAIRVTVDGTYMGQWVDPAPLTGGWPGFQLYTNTVPATSVALKSWSDMVTDPPPPPNAPTTLTITGLGTSGATIGWTDVSDNESAFLVQLENPSGSNSWTNALGATNPTAANVTSFKLQGLLPDSPYKVRVKGTNLWGNSDWLTSSEFRTAGVAQIFTMMDFGPF